MLLDNKSSSVLADICCSMLPMFVLLPARQQLCYGCPFVTIQLVCLHNEALVSIRIKVQAATKGQARMLALQSTLQILLAAANIRLYNNRPTRKNNFDPCQANYTSKSILSSSSVNASVLISPLS